MNTFRFHPTHPKKYMVLKMGKRRILKIRLIPKPTKPLGERVVNAHNYVIDEIGEYLLADKFINTLFLAFLTIAALLVINMFMN